MRHALCLLLISSLAWAEPPADAPIADPPIPDLPPRGLVVELEAGALVPWAATCLDKPQARRAAKLEAYYRGKAADLVQPGNTTLPTAAVVAVIGTGAAAVITSIVLGVALASTPRQ